MAPIRIGPWRLVWDPGHALIPASQVFATNLSGVHHNRKGEVLDARDLGSGTITNVGVGLLASDWTNSTATLKLMKYHDCGTGTTPAAVADTALQTPTGLSRQTGTQVNPTNGVYQTVSTFSFAGSYAVTEWGLFDASSSGHIWDHKVFLPYSVSSGDTITFTYSLTCPAGG